MSITRWMKKRVNHVALIMMVTLALLVVTEPQIGLTWDEPDYIVASEAYSSWFGRLITQPAEALSKTGIEESWSINHEHPPLDKIWSGIVWSGARYVFDDLTAHRLGNMILVSVMAGLLYLLIAESYGLLAGVAAVAALLTLPRLFFHAHLAALDVPAAFTVFFVVFLFWKTRDDSNRKWTLALGLVFGLAFATKINAIFLPPALFLWALLFQRERMMLERIVLMTLIGVLFSFVVWPWLYPDFPARVIDYLKWITVEHWQIGQWYLGSMYMPPPWHFPFVMVWAVVPLTITLLYWTGIIRALWKRREAGGLGGLLIINALAPLLALTTGNSMVYDNERLFMPAFIFLAALAGMGFGWLEIGIRRLADRLQKARWIMPATALAAVLFLMPQSISLVRLYPHLLSYYSETVGGLPGAERLGLETTYWCESYAAALPYLNEHAQPGDTVWVDPWSHNVMIYYQLHGRLRDDVKIAFPPYAQSSLFPEYGPATIATYDASDFIVVQYRQTTIGSTPENPGSDSFNPHPDFQWLSAHAAEFQLTYDDVPIMEVYYNPAAQDIEDSQESEFEPAVPLIVNGGARISETGNFSVQVPPDLEFFGITQELDSAGGIRLNIYEASGDGNNFYSIIYFDFPAEMAADPGASQSLLAGARDGWLQEIQGTLVEENALSLGEYPGTEGVVEAENNGQPINIKYRSYLVQNRYYQLAVVIPIDGTFSEEMEAFLQSFALLEDE
jgi:hypothetical protein